jgi:hypothetical protein
MPRSILYAIPTLLVLLCCSCSNDPFPVDAPVVRFGAELFQPFVVPVSGTQPGIVDSLVVSRVRVLVRAVQLHQEGKDDASGFETVQMEPIVLSASAAWTAAVQVRDFPTSTYDAVRCELYRLSDAEAQAYTDHPDFGDFAGAERYSVIIEGTVYKGEEATPFRFATNPTQQLWLQFASPLGVPRGSTTDITLSVRIPTLFLTGEGIVDPTQTSNRSFIEARLLEALRIAKKDF